VETKIVITFNLGSYQSNLEAALGELRHERILERIWQGDHTVWQPDPSEVSNRLGWLHSPQAMPAALPQIQALVDSVRRAGYTQALLLGMGGSSLAPEVFQKTFGAQPGFLELRVLDSTDPGAVLDYSRQFDPPRSLYVVSTKSGGTVETFSFFKYFYNQVIQAVGREHAGEHFIAITDPGSRLAEIGREYGFRAVILNDPDIGGRYSALSYFGLLPAAAHRSQDAASQAAILGLALGELAKTGRDKLTLLPSPQLASFGDWLE
jgi:glucose-6-phosphate isomerase